MRKFITSDGSVTARSSKSSDRLDRLRLGRLLPDAADADVGVGSKVEPGCLAARGVNNEQRIAFSELLHQTIAYRIDGLRRRQDPHIVDETMGGPERHDRPFEAAGRM